MRLHLVTDTRTGETRIQGRDGTRYTSTEYENARALARTGDLAARAIIANIDMPPGMTAEQMMHDCPECRAGLERGEKPVGGLLVTARRINRHGVMTRRPRWRHLKRVAAR